ncbi:hypothetical protein [Piscibacillus salipiscarius]|nr:hypothetical protein [Piscibacillus salipiscarius]
MNQQQLMKMKPEERVVYVNEMLKKETTDHLKKCSSKARHLSFKIQ